MPTKREYLIEKGLAKPTRGRFTREAVAAIAAAEAEGMVFDEPVKPGKPAKEAEDPDHPRPRSEKIDRWTRALEVPTKVMRDYTLMQGITDDGLIVQFGDCQACDNRIQYCQCLAGPYAPAGLTNVVPV